MPELVDNYEFRHGVTVPRMADWGPFMDGRTYRLTRGVDWDAKYNAVSAAGSLREYARVRHSLAMEINIESPDKLVAHVIGPYRGKNSVTVRPSGTGSPGVLATV